MTPIGGIARDGHVSGSDPDSVRARLVAAVEHRFYSGDAAGQMWLHDLSEYLQRVPAVDDRLRRAAGSPQSAVADYLVIDSRPLASDLDASEWLDRCVEWLEARSTSDPSAAPSDS